MEKNPLFIHIPKTAGTSVIRSLMKKKEDLDIIYFGHDPVWRKIPKKFLNHYFKFTFVRNPWDRVVSGFFYLSQHPRHQKYYKKYNKDFDLFMKDFEAGLFPYDVVFKAQYKFLVYREFPSFKEVLVPDYIAHFESVQEDFNNLCKQFDIKPYQLLHERKMKHKHYTEYYNDWSKEVVRKIYKKDIELLGYDFNDRKTNL